mgnify:FL=1
MQVGLILIGDELLSGLRQDKHIPHVRSLLQERGLAISWVRMVSDDMPLLVQTLKETFSSDDVVFSFGGIGATPDDLTRQAAADATGYKLHRHPQAVKLLEQKFGQEAYPNRILMSELPEGATLLPNPINQIPGFKLKHHHFVPGFPNMAWPMVEYALDTYYQHLFDTAPLIERRWLLRQVLESELIPMMEELLELHPGVRLSSLPSTAERQTIDFGLKGKTAELKSASDWFEQRMLQEDKIIQRL